MQVCVQSGSGCWMVPYSTLCNENRRDFAAGSGWCSAEWYNMYMVFTRRAD